jgi:hypothetical protein
MVNRRTALLGFALLLACGQAADEMEVLAADTDEETNRDDETGSAACSDRFSEASCIGGGSPRFVVGDFDIPDGAPPVIVAEFEGGRLVEGNLGDIEVIYSEGTCLVTCVWTLPQTRFCEGVGDEGETTCAFGTNDELSVEDCMDFTASCGG